MTSIEKIGAPYMAPIQHVLPEWIDGNGHMNVAYYSLAFDRALDAFFQELGIGWDYTEKGEGSTFVLEAHVSFLREVKQGDPLRISYQLLGCDAKRMHYFGQMLHAGEGFLAATSEQIAVHVDMKTRRSSNFPGEVVGLLDAVRVAHAALPVPPQAGRSIGLKKKA